MKRFISILLAFAAGVSFLSCSNTGHISGELKKWHRITLTFEGPNSSETADPNPFLDYRLNVTFFYGDNACVVPGFYAADGNAGETGVTAGNKWRVFFTPDRAGEWTYYASFRAGEKIALSNDPEAGTPTSFDGAQGRFLVKESDKTENDARAKGALRYVGEHYLQFAETGDYFLKGGADSPENFLAYYEFDNAERIARIEGETREGEAQKILQGGTHTFAPHAGDWRPGDPTWQNGKGKNIIGALNYLADKGMNSVYFLTMNVGGDGKDVWPWTKYDERYRYDCSKLDQWDIVLSHMDKLGIMQHVVLTETENEALFEIDEGISTTSGFADSRKLYYREMMARFGYHPAMVYNLGEENGWDNKDVPYGAANSEEQRKMFADWLKTLDPYDHPIVVHTLPGRYDEIYTPLLGHGTLDGPSLQMGDQSETHAETAKWIQKSAAAQHKWFVCLDEIGPAHTGVKPDADDYWHDDVRHYSLWGNLMAGGSGCEWYFGYQYPHNDLNCEDWRSRDHMWDLTRYALLFFQQHLPFWEMRAADDLISVKEAYCFAKPGEVYAIYVPNGGSCDVELTEDTYSVKWYNPRTGGELIDSNVTEVRGPGRKSIGLPPEERQKDWVALLKQQP
ncbi:DUF5060 domain-containing protein [candidate division KSB1 bacterium]|nr:DUF5060 domain-containing protein [candidate division KSB1 bacterium]RQW00326.1 MAG: DUF5060 domain-containing protein [candidate division KSB1 bacterium]